MKLVDFINGCKTFTTTVELVVRNLETKTSKLVEYHDYEYENLKQYNDYVVQLFEAVDKGVMRIMICK